MFAACATCFTSFATLRALKLHERRYHPNSKEEQIVCKTCNIPFSDPNYLKRHIKKLHNSELSTVTSPCTETNQNKESGNTQTIDDDYTRKLRNL